MQDIPDSVATAGRRRGWRAPAAGGCTHEAACGLPPGVARQRAAPLHHVGTDPAARLHVRFHWPPVPCACGRQSSLIPRNALAVCARCTAQLLALLSHRHKRLLPGCAPNPEWSASQALRRCLPCCRALGTVVVGGVDAPECSEVLCVSQASAKRGRLFDAPAWRYEPPMLGASMNLQRLKPYHPETWRCSLWQVWLSAGAHASAVGALNSSMLWWAIERNHRGMRASSILPVPMHKVC